MDPSDMTDTLETESDNGPQARPVVVPQAPAAARPAAPASMPNCPTCGGVVAPQDGGMSSPFVYALGQIEARFPRPSVEKEMAQATGRAETAGKTDQQAFNHVLSQRENRYLARQLCWVLTIQGLETYILQPRDPADIDLLIDATQPQATPWTSAVIGVRGPVASPDYCNGLMLPIVVFDQIYTFAHSDLIKAIPRPEGAAPDAFEPAAQALFDRIMQMADNAGSADDHRALNYLCMRYPAIYAKVAEAFADDQSLSGVEVRPSPLSGTRNIVDVIFSFTNRNTDYTEKYFVRVDVNDQFPFLVAKLSPYYDR
jgi:hypothetical protein